MPTNSRPPPPPRRAADLPAGAVGRTVVLREKLLIELLDVGVNAPALAVDDDLDEIGFGGWHVFAGDLRIEHGAQHGIVFMGVEQIEGFIAVQPLLGVREVDRDVQRAFVSRGDHHVGRVSAEVDADAWIAFAVDNEGRRKFDVGIVEVGQFRLPVVPFEIEKQRPQDGRFVKLCVGVVSSVRGCDLWAGLRGFLILPSSETRRTEATSARSARASVRAAGASWTAEGSESAAIAPFFAFFSEKLAGLLPFLSVESAVFVRIELIDHPSLSAGTARTERTARGTERETARRAERKTAGRTFAGLSPLAGIARLVRGLS